VAQGKNHMTVCALICPSQAQEDSAEVEETEHERDFTGTPYVPIYVMLPVCIFVSLPSLSSSLSLSLSLSMFCFS